MDYNLRTTLGANMSLTIQMQLEDEARLAMKAKDAGVDLPTYVERVLKVEISRPPLDEMLKPVWDAFADSGMSEEELSELLVSAKKQMRAERRSRGQA
jgi:hypothetical protein